MRDHDPTLPTRRVEFEVETARRPGRLVLKLLDADRAGESIEVSAPVLTVGRSSLADVQIEARELSAVHFELRASASGAVLEDLHSTNGVWFHGRKVRSIELEVGDEFSAGERRFVLADCTEVEVEVLATDKLGELRGSSLAMRELYSQINSLAPTPLDILLLGETGTGKGVIARTIHRLSGRRGPLIVLDCGALSPSLAEATIFGHGRGAFTGAERSQAGVFEAADGGTLFIDEIGELPLALQVKLLRALDDREVTRLGEPGQARAVDLRVVSATHRDLRQGVVDGSFREDLYYRLARAELRVPPLRERGDDVRELAEAFMRELCETYGLEVQIGDDAAQALRRHAWPGNVRELRNAIERATHVKRHGTVAAADLCIHGRARPTQAPGAHLLEQMMLGERSYHEVHAEVDKLLLARTLELHDHNLTRVSKSLGISRDKLRARLKELGLYTRS